MTKDKQTELMKQSISLARQTVSVGGRIIPKNSAIITNAQGEKLLEYYRSQANADEHCEVAIINEAIKRKINLKETELFLVLEPCITKAETGCAKLICDAGIKRVYIGANTPETSKYGKGIDYLISKGVEVIRYPSQLSKTIIKMNTHFYSMFDDSTLSSDLLFVKLNISKLMIEYLNNSGYMFRELPDNWNVDLNYVVAYCHSISDDINTRQDIINKALGYAYDKKYAYRDYSDDVRGVYTQWIKEFKHILNELNVFSLKNKKTLVVGIGNGQEGKYLYSDVADLILVDIAPKSLQIAKDLLRPKESYVMSAQNLYKIKDESIEAYISLLTYQSTYFDVNQALVEAYRVLKKKGIIIISVACGFINSDGVYVNGLKKPRTNKTDRNRPYEIIDMIRRRLISFNFYSLGIRSTPSEIYIYAKKKTR